MTPGVPVAASVPRRLAATLIDLLLLGITTFIVLLVTGLIETPDAYIGSAIVSRIGIAVLIAWLVLNGWFLLRGAQSPGKRLLGLRLVDRRGLALPFWRCLLRPLTFVVPALTPIWWLPLAGLLLGVMPDRRCLHDWVVDSRVVTVPRTVEVIEAGAIEAEPSADSSRVG